jgi:peptidoglycan/LPS O-acetylase OafA/YrhL
MQRVKELESIRGLALVAIVIYHLWLSNIGLLGSAADLLIVLSGFLITSILLTHVMSHRFLVSFYARRALRIWPICYLSLSILVLLNPFMPGPESLKLLKDRFGYQHDAAPAPFREGREQVPCGTAPVGLDDAFKLARSLTLAKASTAKAR